MLSRRPLMFFFALALVSAVGTPCALARTPVTAGASYDGAVEGEETVNYTLELDADTFVRGFVEQESVDAVVTVYGPDGEEIGSFDVTAEGPDRFRFEAEAQGTYRFEVAGFEGDTGGFSFSVEVAEPVATEGAARIDQRLSYLDPEGPGLVVGVYQNGETIFARAYGMANLTYGIPFTVDTPSNLGSTSKQFTAFAIALLDERGELSLDDDVRTHIPELPDFGPTVTLRHLVHHTSGYREFLNAMAIAGIRFDTGDSIARSEVVELIQRQPELQNQPGEEWNYNNSGYALLTLVVERATGTPFEEWVAREVFGPLGMESSTFRASQRQIVEGHAAGYTMGGAGEYLEARDLGGAMGAGGMYSTVADLGRWIHNFSTGELGGPGMFEKQTETYVLADGNDTDYAMGLFIDEFGGLERVQHGGANIAHRAMLQYFPEIDAGVVVLSNFAGVDSMQAANDAARAFFGDAFADEDEGAALAGDDDAGGEDFDPAAYDPAWFEPLAGRYELEVMPGFIMEFTEEDGAYFAEATGQPRLEIVPTSRTRFVIEMVDAAIEFGLDDDGACEALTLFQNGEHRAVRVEGEKWSPDEEELSAFIGTYYSRELRTEYEVVAGEDGGLALKHHRYPDPMALTPGEDEDSFLAGFPIAELVFERDESGSITRFIAGNGRTRGIVFDRQD